MCIICNLHAIGEHNAVNAANNFLDAFKSASVQMEQATKAMLEVAKIDRGYDHTHKEMVNICKTWNKIEQTREVDRQLRIKS